MSDRLMLAISIAIGIIIWHLMIYFMDGGFTKDAYLGASYVLIPFLAYQAFQHYRKREK